MTPAHPPSRWQGTRARRTPAAREDAMTALGALNPTSPRRRAIVLSLASLLAGCAATESMPPEHLSALRAKAQACNEALPDITHHDVDRFGRVQTGVCAGRRRGRDPPELPRLRRGQGAVDYMGARSTATDARAPRPRQAGSKSRTSRALTDSGAPGPHRGPQARRGSREPPGHPSSLAFLFRAARSRRPSPPVHRRAPPPDKPSDPGLPRTRDQPQAADSAGGEWAMRDAASPSDGAKLRPAAWTPRVR